jgi:hypothetical protein
MASELGHVRWIGGGSGAGKTTVTSILARSLGLPVYSTDAQIAAHGAEPGPDAPLLSHFLAMNMDERWLVPDPKIMLKTFPWFAGERFERVVRDLQGVPRTPLTLAEGFRLRPDLILPVLGEPWQAVWLIPTRAFRRAAFARRPAEEQFWLRTSDPATALERLLVRDAMFTDAVARDAARLQFKIIMIDGTREASQVASEVAQQLRLT